MYFNIFEYVMYSFDGKAEFSAAISPVFGVTWSFINLNFEIDIDR